LRAVNLPYGAMVSLFGKSDTPTHKGSMALKHSVGARRAKYKPPSKLESMMKAYDISSVKPQING